MKKITATEKVPFNKVVIIRSHKEIESGPSRRMSDEMAQITLNNNIGFDEFDVGTLSELSAVLLEVSATIERGIYPILIFDAHGDDENIVLSTEDSYELVSWFTLGELLRPLNILTKNFLVCVFSVCFGANFARSMDILKPVPYYMIVGPVESESSVLLETSIPSFVESLCLETSVLEAFNKNFREGFEIINSQRLFAIAFANYVNRECNDEALRKRALLIISQAGLDSDFALSNLNQRLIKIASIIDELKPTEAQFKRFADKFLIGREPVFSFAELMKFVDTLESV